MHHNLYCLDPLISLSADTLGPLKEDKLRNHFIFAIVDNFLKLVGLYPARNATPKEFVPFFNECQFSEFLKRSAQMKSLSSPVSCLSYLLYRVIII